MMITLVSRVQPPNTHLKHTYKSLLIHSPKVCVKSQTTNIHRAHSLCVRLGNTHNTNTLQMIQTKCPRSLFFFNKHTVHNSPFAPFVLLCILCFLPEPKQKRPKFNSSSIHIFSVRVFHKRDLKTKTTNLAKTQSF